MLLAPSRSAPLLRTRLPRREYGTLALPVSASESKLDRVRCAGAAFVRGATIGWSRRDLERWLVCQYAPCVAVSDAVDGRAAAPASERVQDEGMLERVVVHALAAVRERLRDLAVPELASPIARVALSAGSVILLPESGGAAAYAPVALPGLELSERVGALFVADYLNRPDDYRRLKVCPHCGELSFTGELEHAGWCEATPSRC